MLSSHSKPLADWTGSFVHRGPLALTTTHATWFAVETVDTAEGRALVQFEVADAEAGRALVDWARAWVDPAAVPVVSGGVAGSVCWLVYGRGPEAPDDTGPLGVHDVVTLGLEMAAVAQRALQAGLTLPPLRLPFVVQDFLPDGTFRPRLLGVGSPGPARDEVALAAGIGALLVAAVFGHDEAPLEVTPTSLAASAVRLPESLSHTLIKSHAGRYTTLEALRTDLSASSVARSRRAARVGVTTDHYPKRGGENVERSAVGGVAPAALPEPRIRHERVVAPLPEPAPVLPPQPATRRRAWLWPTLIGVVAVLVLIFVLLDPFGGRSQSTTGPTLASRATTQPDRVGASTPDPMPAQPPVTQVAPKVQDTTSAVGTSASDTTAPDTAAPDTAAPDTALREPNTNTAQADAGPTAAVADAGPTAADTLPAAGKPPAPEPQPTRPEVADTKAEAPIAPELSSLTLESKPAGALVSADGAELGRTPLLIAQPIARFPLRVRVEKRGHTPAVVVLADPRAATFRVTLKPLAVAPSPSGNGSGTINLER